jgi:hypothetical protein
VADASDVAALDRRVKQLTALAARAEEQQVVAVLREVTVFQGEIRAMVAQLDGGFVGFALDVERRAAVLAEVVAGLIGDGLPAAVARGVELVDAPLAAARVELTPGRLSARLLADQRRPAVKALVDRHVADLRGRVTAAGLRVATGVEDPAGAAKAVGRKLGGSAVFGRPASMLAAVARTETATITGEATHERMVEVAEARPDVRKRWVQQDRDARPSHHRVELATMGGIPLEARFAVAGVRVRMPRERSLPAGERVNCRCRVVPVLT